MIDTFSEFLSHVSHTYMKEYEWRFGQTCFNVLYELDEDLANCIRGTDIDPFYDDVKVPEFLKRLRDEWNEDE
jgi:hypothetical protein